MADDFAAEIRKVVEEMRKLRRDAERFAIRHEILETNRRLARLEKLAEGHAAEVGRAVGDAINRAAASGQRRRSPEQILRDDIQASAQAFANLYAARVRRDTEVAEAKARYAAEVRRINGE